MKRVFAILLGLAILPLAGVSQTPEPELLVQLPKVVNVPDVAQALQGQAKPKADAKHPRGRKLQTEEQLKKLHDDAFKRNDHRMKNLPKATPSWYDLRVIGKWLKAGNQGQCGNCYNYSLCRVASTAMVRASAGTLKYDNSFRFAAQYGLDCQSQLGGCNGGDEAQVATLMMIQPWPIESCYGSYNASPGTCNNSCKGYLIQNMIYCTPSQQSGVASTQDVKNAILQFGEISTAVAADGSWDSYSGGVLPFAALTPNDVNHAVSIIGYKDDPTLPSGGYWIVENNWGDTWGDGTGCINIQYGSHQICTESFGITCTQTPPTPPTPVPPTPVPPTPVPPGPAPTPPAPTNSITFTVPGATVPAYSFTVRTGLRNTQTITIPAVQLPDTTVTVPLPAMK